MRFEAQDTIISTFKSAVLTSYPIKEEITTFKISNGRYQPIPIANAFMETKFQGKTSHIVPKE